MDTEITVSFQRTDQNKAGFLDVYNEKCNQMIKNEEGDYD